MLSYGTYTFPTAKGGNPFGSTAVKGSGFKLNQDFLFYFYKHLEANNNLIGSVKPFF